MDATLSVALGALAVLYALAALGKARHIGYFEIYLRSLAAKRTRVLALVTIATEAVLAVALGCGVGWHAFAPYAAGVSSLFILVATIVYGLGLRLGGETVCNCFGRRDESGYAVREEWRPALLATRNAAIFAVGLFAMVGATPSSVALCMVIPLVVGLALVASVRRERRLIEREVHPLVASLSGAVRRLQVHGWWVNGHPRGF